jgi:hypothetical protein
MLDGIVATMCFDSGSILIHGVHAFVWGNEFVLPAGGWFYVYSKEIEVVLHDAHRLMHALDNRSKTIA